MRAYGLQAFPNCFFTFMKTEPFFAPKRLARSLDSAAAMYYNNCNYIGRV